MSNLSGLKCGSCGSTRLRKPNSLLARILMLEGSVRCVTCKKFYAIEFCERVKSHREKRAGSYRDYDD